MRAELAWKRFFYDLSKKIIKYNKIKYKNYYYYYYLWYILLLIWSSSTVQKFGVCFLYILFQ